MVEASPSNPKSKTHNPKSADPDNPLKSLEDWDQFLVERYPEPAAISAGKAADDYRNYDSPERDTVREFYRLNHRSQTLDFVLRKKREWLAFDKQAMTPWQALEYLNTLVDDSDPDINLSQIDHIFQTAEAIRADGHPDWFVLTGLLHDVGKILCLFGEPQWAVVGDTFPVGCRFSDKIVYHEFFADNPDTHVAEYQSPLGIYSEGCGLDSVHLSWSHDEYLYQMLKDHLPLPALTMIRYHSFYPAHREGEYEFLMNTEDKKMMRWVQLFNPYDLYSKCPAPPNVAELKPYYEDLMAKYLPPTLQF